MSNMEDNQDSGFIDEIFQWPIAKINVFAIWDYMFKNYLTSATDQSNLLLASSQYFVPHLEKRKCSIHFGEVIHVLHNHNYLDVSKAELLNYRSWSKSCRESLDRSLQLKNQCYQNLVGMDHDICDPHHVCWMGESSGYKIQERNRRCAAEIQVVSRTNLPFLFPCGRLTFSSVSQDNREDHRRYFRQILSVAGAKTYHFRYIICSWASTWNTSYDFLTECLELMPNLRTLEILNKTHWRICGQPECNATLQSQPLPNLEQLTALKITNFPARIVNTLLQKYAKRLEKFSIKIGITRHELIYSNRMELLNVASNLSQLSIGLIHSQDRIRRFLNENVNKSLLKLKSLSVLVEQCKEYRSSTIFKELCQTLVRDFGESTRLKTLNIFIQSDRISAAESEGQPCFSAVRSLQRPRFICCAVRLSLPSVKRLWIHVFDVCFSSLDFILGLSNLEELTIKLKKSLPVKAYRVEQIKFVNFWNRMEESNVWELMPKLKTITIRCNERGLPSECYESSRPMLNVIP